MKYFSIALISFFCFFQILSAQESTSGDEKVLEAAEVMPEFPGGVEALFQFLAENTTYPVYAEKMGVEGTIYVGFIVEPDGSITNVAIKRGLPNGGAGCEAEAMRVVSLMPNWKPGILDGTPVRVAFTIPLKFKLTKQRRNQTESDR